MEQLLADYQRLAERRALPAMTAGHVTTEVESFSDPAALEARIAELGPARGWRLCQSGQGIFRDGWPGANPEWGTLLAAEGTLPDGALAVHQDGAGGWRLVRYRHQDGGEGLCDEVELLAQGGGCLCYRRYWEQGPTGPGQVAAILLDVQAEQGE
ncbi:hypothetical protein SAMN05421721_1108 [Ectothiorhodospira mobilis]|uniref:Uncharacterized protein n=1 Tax=Ectothiorhodospira mobilis TaxID=195064 RepID=A0A1I4RW05_ECTMO|nr:hypothetical protein [Ectothiorhodospira mobilis]SFM56193.1 hypothetical protein SAMN05421721_1108 [Ectothiorhodospira mobilis]